MKKLTTYITVLLICLALGGTVLSVCAEETPPPVTSGDPLTPPEVTGTSGDGEIGEEDITPATIPPKHEGDLVF